LLTQWKETFLSTLQRKEGGKDLEKRRGRQKKGGELTGLACWAYYH